MPTSSNNNGWTWSKRLNRSVTSVCPCIGHDPCAPEYVSEDGRRLYGSCSSGCSSAPSVNWDALDAHDIDPRSNQHPDNGPYMSTPPMDIKGKGARHRDDDDYYQGSFLDTRGSTAGDISLGRSEDRLLPHTARDRREYGTIDRHGQYSNTPEGTVAGPSNTRQGGHFRFVGLFDGERGELAECWRRRRRRGAGRCKPGG